MLMMLMSCEYLTETILDDKCTRNGVGFYSVRSTRRRTAVLFDLLLFLMSLFYLGTRNQESSRNQLACSMNKLKPGRKFDEIIIEK